MGESSDTNNQDTKAKKVYTIIRTSEADYEKTDKELNENDYDVFVPSNEMVLNPFTMKQIKKSSIQYAKLVSEGVIDSSGKIKMSDKEIELRKSSERARKSFARGDLNDAVRNTLHKLSVFDILQVTKTLVEELENRPKEVKEFRDDLDRAELIMNTLRSITFK